MYKVFIDHKPIIFVQKNDLSTEEAPLGDDKKSAIDRITLSSKDVESVSDLKELLKKSSIDNPIYLTSDDPKKEFERFFANYKYIEAAGGIVQRKKSYLVIKRKGLWDIPKGKIEKGESPEVAAVREIMEECGIDGHQITLPLTTTYHVLKWDGQPALKKTYWYMLEYSGTENGYPQEEEQITEVRWMNREELLSIRSNTFGSINELLEVFVSRIEGK